MTINWIIENSDKILSFLYYKYSKTHIIESDCKQIIVGEYCSPTSTLNEHIAIGFYDFKFINRHKKSFTVKDIELHFFNKKTQQVEKLELVNAVSNRLISRIQYNSTTVNIVCESWKNLSIILLENNLLQPGEVFSFSSIFVFPAEITYEDLRNLDFYEWFEFVITDYSNRKKKFKFFPPREELNEILKYNHCYIMNDIDFYNEFSKTEQAK